MVVRVFSDDFDVIQIYCNFTVKGLLLLLLYVGGGRTKRYGAL